MRTVALTPDSGPIVAGTVCHDVRNPHQRNEILVRKGSPLSVDEVRELFQRGVVELHLAVPEPDDVPEDEAARRLAVAVAGPRVEVGEAHAGQVNVTAAGRGMLRVDRRVLERVNELHGVLVLTAEADRPVDAGTTLGVVKCAPLLLSESTLRSVEETVLHVQAFDGMRVAMVAPSDRFRGGAFARSQSALSNALAWYGSELDPVIPSEASTGSMANAYRAAHEAGVALIFAAGAAATDELDVVFEGLRQAGGSVDQIGIPLEPGTACWIGHLASVPVLGLASCELFGRPGALDLLLPWLHTGETLNAALVRRLALGGLLDGPSRIAPYHQRHATAVSS